MSSPPSSSPESSRPRRVKVSASRLEEFFKAEIAYMGKGGYRTITLNDILQHKEIDDLGPLARLIQRELPLRFATRICQIESSTTEWREIPELRSLHKMISHSFKKLRMVTIDPDHLDPFTAVVRDIRKRHMLNLVPTLAQAAAALKERHIFDEEPLHHWIEKFMNSRLGTNMLLQHYEALLSDPDTNHIGIVDLRCNPALVCRKAIEHVQRQLGAESSDVQINLKVAHSDIEFSFISNILFNMVAEVLMNSIRAAQREAQLHLQQRGSSASSSGSAGDDPAHFIDITVCASPKQVVIQISDRGGGIPHEIDDRIWRYMFSTRAQGAGTVQLQEPSPVAIGEIAGGGDSGDFSSEMPAPDVIARGMGLPLCRLYSRYLGGSFKLMTMPGFGTDAFFFLNRIDPGFDVREFCSVNDE